LDPKSDLRVADEYSARALALDPNNYLAHYARAFFLAYQRPDEAIEEAERTLALNPSLLQAYFAFWAASWSAGIRRRQTNMWRLRSGWLRATPTGISS